MMPPAQQTIVATRSKLYWFLSEFYLQQPQQAFLQHLRQQLMTAEATSTDSIDAGLHILQQGLNQASTERLSIEYVRLFGGLKEGYGPPPPYESIYRESRLMGTTTLAVIQRYAQAGFTSIHAATGPQDHIGVELKFMALLCLQEHDAWEQDDAVAAKTSLAHQRDFLDQHLLCWAPSYCKRLQNESKLLFYRGVGLISEQFLQADRALLSSPI